MICCHKRRNIISFRRITKSQTEVLELLSQLDRPVLKEEPEVYFGDLAEVFVYKFKILVWAAVSWLNLCLVGLLQPAPPLDTSAFDTWRNHERTNLR